MNLVARCLEHGWGAVKDSMASRDRYRRSAESGYFRGAYNYATILARECETSAACRWFVEALRTAPEPTRSHMVDTLEKHPRPEFRDLLRCLDVQHS